MKKLIITAILLTTWAGLLSQEIENHSFNQENVLNMPDLNTINKAGTSASLKSYNPASFEAYVNEWYEGAMTPGLSMAMLKNGKLYWVYHYGSANIEENKPVDDSSCFYLASVSKTITQTAIMQLWEQDSFELYDYVGDYLTFSVINPHNNTPITFYQLMTHTATVKSDPTTGWGQTLANFMAGYFDPGGTFYSISNFFNVIPGTNWAYSNIGNSLLGYLTQEMVEQDYGEYCTEHIFQPLGINEGSYYLANINPENLVTQYTYSGGLYNPIATPDGGGPIYPAAVLKMSAIELSKFLGMYMQQGTFNNNTILDPETIELITTPTSWLNTYGWQQCLTWFYIESMDLTLHTGGTNFSSTFMGYDKDDQWGSIVLMNSESNMLAILDALIHFNYFASQYNPITISSISVNDTDGDKVIEANEEFDLGLTLRNDMNYPDVAENIMATISVNSSYINLISDSAVSIGTLNYLEEIQLPSDQFVFSVNENMEPGNVEFQLHFTWDGGNDYTTTFQLFVGHAAVLLVRDEESISVVWDNGSKRIEDLYLEPLDSLGYLSHFWNLETMGDPTAAFINNFPAVIWFTGSDAENTISEDNQMLLAAYLDNGGQLFISGQNISDELAGTEFLENHLHVEHLENNINENSITGIENDPIGNGLSFSVNGELIENQYSMSVVDALEDAHMVFRYVTTFTKGAAIRYENDTYKSVFFAFGFEAINGLFKRQEILGRILNDYFIMPHPCLPEGITFTTQEEIDNFQTNFPNCTEIEGDVVITGNNITNLYGLSVLTNIKGGLEIGNTEALPYLIGLNNVTFIGGDLNINNNDALSSITGLNNVASIGGNLQISNNDFLTSLSGLENIEAGSISDLYISDNSSLANCDAYSICDYLLVLNGTYTIQDNATGCNSFEEVEAACLVTSVQEISTDETFTISPNPGSGAMHLRFTIYEQGFTICDLYEISGVKVKGLLNEEKTPGTFEMEIDLSDLPNGVYFCVLKTPQYSKTKKIIKLN